MSEKIKIDQASLKSNLAVDILWKALVNNKKEILDAKGKFPFEVEVDLKVDGISVPFLNIIERFDQIFDESVKKNARRLISKAEVDFLKKINKLKKSVAKELELYRRNF